MFNSYLLDSNILIGFLNGNKEIIKWVMDKKEAGTYLYVSFISSIELMSLKGLKDSEVENIEKFLNSFSQISINDEIIKLTSALRRKSVLTLGDAIIAGSAISRKITLVTNDKTLSKKASQFVEVISI